jgi:Histidine kinase-, DNA gyrase B-, and HSP90-like ATPase
MIKFLEDVLYEKTKDTQSSILFNQWNYDKKVIPVALQAVSNLFPHYSLHDESHSITIVNNIARVIGKENLAKLSAIDIWLLLEAAYSHDIGMVVSSDKMIEALNSTKFMEFFKDLKENPKSGLHEFADQFNIVDNKVRLKSDLFSLQTNDAIKFILAEFFRWNHADRSKEIINNPTSEFLLASPRGVIPQRITEILSNICSCHTKDFADVMNLPFCEVGIDTEDAHPRFIASLLRIGDLLDLDNNRFSEIILSALTKIPSDTLNHKAKHLSIKHFRVDKERIEITAFCKEYEVYSITQHWFNYLDSEMKNQMINWNNIVPFKEFGYLPTIGHLDVKLSDYELIDGKKKPQFTVDTDKALSLLQGAGIYDGAYQCIREILQNAVDATLLRIWLEHHQDRDFSTPKSEDFLEQIKNYPIQIKITEKGIEGDFQNWEIEIKDNGTGISGNDLKYLMQTGSSSKNHERTRVIESMPLWMRPSGTFGIGFQSIFMLTDSVRIETKSFSDEEFQTIELYSPNSSKDGDILIKKRKTSHSTKPGSNIFFKYKTEAIPNRFSVNFKHTNAHRIWNNYDPFFNDSLDIELGRIYDEIFDFADKCYIPILLKVNNQSIDTTTSSEKFDYFDLENAIELNIYDDYNGRSPFNIFYKNQTTEGKLSSDFLGFDINIHKDKASTVLTLNRNKIQPDYENELEEYFFVSAFRIITENFDTIFKTDDSKGRASMFLHYYSRYYVLKDFDITRFNQWESIIIDDVSTSILELLSTTETITLVHEHSDLQDKDVFSLENKHLTIFLNKLSVISDITKFILSKIPMYFSSFVFSVESGFDSKKMIISKKESLCPVPEDEFKKIILSLRNRYTGSARMTIPCLDNFKKLKIKNDVFKSFVYNYQLSNLSRDLQLPYPRMISPFVRQQDNDSSKNILIYQVNENLINWVYENRFDNSTTKKDIEEAYENFCAMFDLEEINNTISES